MMTTKEVAQQLNRSRHRVWQAAQRMGLGRKIAGRYVFTEGEVALMFDRLGKVGTPLPKESRARAESAIDRDPIWDGWAYDE